MNDLDAREAAHDQPLTKQATNPVMAEVTRGVMVESRHRAAVAVVDAGGQVVLSAGDIERPVYARSAIKSLQAIPFIESGAADAFGVSDPEIALACASHAGEPRHVETVLAWLERIGCSVEDLQCGAHLPNNTAAAHALIARGAEPSAAHNNCSGKHAGFLTLARHLNAPTGDYLRHEHAVQQRVLGVLESMAGLDLGDAPRGIDGCGIPVIGMPLGNLALAMARLADPHDQPDARQAACARIRTAMTAEPFMVGGTGSYCTRAIKASRGRALIKTGAEGVYCGALPELGLGLALKVDDGAERAAEAIVGRLLRRFEAIGPDEAGFTTHPIYNRAGREVGEVRAPEGAPF